MLERGDNSRVPLLGNPSSTGRQMVRLVATLLALAPLSLTLLAPTSAAQQSPSIDLLVSGVLETVPRESGVGLDTSLVLDDGSRLELVRTPAMPPSGRVSATVTVAASTMPSLAGRSLDALSDEVQPLLEALRTEPLRLRDAAYDVAAAAPAPTRHRFHLAVPTNLGDFGAMTDTALVDLLAEAGAFWTTESEGIISGVDVSEPLRFVSTAAAATSSCGLGSYSETQKVWDEADDLFPGVDFSSGPDHLVVVIPDECQVSGTIGLGTLGRSLADGGKVLLHAERPGAVNVLTHELGHNVGLMHARGTSCSPFNPDYCPVGEYDDLYDPMGYGIGTSPTALNSAHREDLGLVDPGERAVVALPDADATRTVSARILPRSNGSGLRTVVVVDPETQDRYFVDYRSGTGRDAGGAYATGYTLFGTTTYVPGVTIVQASDQNATVLRMRSPAVNEIHGAWQAGEVFANRSGSVSVRVDAVAPGQHADVTVTVHTDFVPFVDPPRPVVAGAPVVGRTLTVDPGAWPDGTVLDVRWLVDGVEVPRQDNQFAFYLYLNYRGSRVEAEVRASRTGIRSVIRRSVPTGVVANPVWGSVWLYAGGGVRVGVPVTSTISASPEGAARSLQWLSNGVPIAGATAPAYTPVAGDIDALLSLQVGLTADGFDPALVVSNEVGPVQAAVSSPTPTPASTPTATPQPPLSSVPPMTSPPPPVLGALQAPRPTIRGVAKVAVRLTVRTGRWTPGTRLRFQWLANGKPVRGATRSAYVVGRALRGKRLSVRVTGTRAGYAPATVTSARTRPVR